MKLIANFTLKLPIAADALGQWLEAHGAEISTSCALGTYHVHVSKKKLPSYNDTDGEHAEHWTVSRYNRDLMTALSAALLAAGALSPEPAGEVLETGDSEEAARAFAARYRSVQRKPFYGKSDADFIIGYYQKDRQTGAFTTVIMGRGVSWKAAIADAERHEP